MYSGRNLHPLGRGLRIIGMVILGVVTAIIFGLLFGYFIELLWNWLMPSIFKLGKITYWQAFGLVLLARLIFGGIGHEQHGHHRDRHHHWRKNGECHGGEEKWRIKGGWQDWDHYDSWWCEEGKAAFEKYVDKVEHKEENP
jgi:uncharacterized membrane protein YraQ (UPF0718 family)